MCCCISSRCRTDISTLYISDDHKVFRLTVIYGLLKCHQSRNSELLVHCDLWFYCRNQIISLVNDLLIELPYCLCCSFQSLTILCISLIKYVLWDVVQHWIESNYDRCTCLFDLLYQFINHSSFLHILLLFIELTINDTLLSFLQVDALLYYARYIIFHDTIFRTIFLVMLFYELIFLQTKRTKFFFSKQILKNFVLIVIFNILPAQAM